MALRLKKMLEERANVWDQMKALREQAGTREDAVLSAEERAKWDGLEARLSELGKNIEDEQRMDALDRTIETNKEKDARAAFSQDEDRPAVKVDDAYRDVFREWVRNGTSELSGDQRKLLRNGFIAADKENRALGVGTGAAGGYAVPQGFRDTLVETMKFYNAVRPVATVITTDSGATLPWPVNNDTANVGAILAENTQISAQDVSLAQEQLSAYMYTSKLVLVSYQLLQDSAIDVESFLARKLGQRIGRIQNQHFTTGTGSSQPLGLITGATQTKVQAATGGTTGVKYADLVAALYSIDPAYRQGPNIKWMFSDTALAAIRNLVDIQGRPLWEPSTQAGQPDTLLGKGLIINNDLAVPAVNAKIGAIGDFEAGYVIRDVKGVTTVRLDERYADFLQVGWFAYARTDATVQDTAAYTVLVQAAS